MSKFVKELMMDQLKTEIEGHDSGCLMDISGLSGNETTELRSELAKSGIKVRVVKNNVARLGSKDTPLAPLFAELKGRNALVYGQDVSVIDVAKKLVEQRKKHEKIELKVGIIEGTPELIPVEQLSKMKGKQELLSDVLGLILSPARKFAGCAKGAGGRLAGLAKALQEKLEKGETISKAS